MGTMTITASQQGVSVGRFDPDKGIESNPLLRFKTAMKGDTVVPRLKIDSSVLFDPGKEDLKGAVKQELDKIAAFVKSFSPSKLIIEGHTDSDGDDVSNQGLFRSGRRRSKTFWSPRIRKLPRPWSRPMAMERRGLW